MRHSWKYIPLIAGMMLTACVNTPTEEIRRESGHGTQFTISGMTYNQVWGAANRAIERNYAVAKRDQFHGVIEVERRPENHRWKEQVMVFITPADKEAPTYTVEVAVPEYMKTKMTSKNFEAVVLEDIKAELDMIPDKEGLKRKLGL